MDHSFVLDALTSGDWTEMGTIPRASNDTRLLVLEHAGRALRGQDLALAVRGQRELETLEGRAEDVLVPPREPHAGHRSRVTDTESG